MNVARVPRCVQRHGARDRCAPGDHLERRRTGDDGPVETGRHGRAQWTPVAPAAGVCVVTDGVPVVVNDQDAGVIATPAALMPPDATTE